MERLQRSIARANNPAIRPGGAGETVNSTDAAKEDVSVEENVSTAPGQDASPDVPAAAGSRAKVSRAEALLYFLDRYRGETWRLEDIRDKLVEEGLLEGTEADTHGLQVTASRLYRTGKLDRPSRGHYRLSRNGTEED
jgi:hypothetical protein